MAGHSIYFLLVFEASRMDLRIVWLNKQDSGCNVLESLANGIRPKHCETLISWFQLVPTQIEIFSSDQAF